MAGRDQLEIIAPTGELEFHLLDPNRGVTNLGSHPSNDVVLRGADIADFHLMFDHRRQPVEVTALSPLGSVRLQGAAVPVGQSQPIHNWDTLEVGGYAIILLEEEAPPAAVAPPPVDDRSREQAVATTAVAAADVAGEPAPVQVAAVAAPPAAAVAAPPAAAVAALGGMGYHLPDLVDDIILAELSTREQVVDVEQTAGWQLVITNGGPIVARLEVRLEGWLDGAWVSITPPAVNLNEGERATVNITATPPRSPASRAGAHHFAVVVTSPNYPGRRTQLGASLAVNPYFDFAISDITPKDRTISYFRKSGAYELDVRNLGNSQVRMQITGIDDQAATSFEFMLPGEEVSLARQAEFDLPPDEAVTIPMAVTPLTRQIVGARKHGYMLTVTTTMLGGEATPRSVLAQLGARPLIGPWVVTAALLALALILVVVLQPRIREFDFAVDAALTVQEGEVGEAGVAGVAGQVSELQGAKIFGIKLPKMPKMPKQLKFLEALLPGDGAAAAEAVEAVGSVTITQAGTEVTLLWDTARAGSLTLEKAVDGNRIFVAAIEQPNVQRQYTFVADQRERATYILTARNWIERIPVLGETFGIAESRIALVTQPVSPEIRLFNVDPPSIVTGQVANVNWQIDAATEYDLLINGVARPLEDARGTLAESPQVDTSYQLEARSPYWEGPVRSEVKLLAVSLPTPVIRTFSVGPDPIIDGQNVAVGWEVSGADQVSIEPAPGAVPNLQGVDEVLIEPGRSQETFTLIAKVGQGDQAAEVRATRLLAVVTATPTVTPTPTPTQTPTPTGTPVPTPVIRQFAVEPQPIIDGQNVALVWEVVGATLVEIAPVPGPVPNLEGRDEVQVEPGQSEETFTLRAVMFDGFNSAEVRAVRVVPVVTPTPTPTLTGTPTATPLPTPVIMQFNIQPDPIIEGNNVAVLWGVEGAQVVEIDPVPGPVPNLEGREEVQVDAGLSEETFTLRALADNGIATAEVRVTRVVAIITPTPTPSPTLPPPPTNTPTSTPTPAPEIASFSISGVSANDVIIPVASQGGAPTYQADAGTQVKLSWTVLNAVSQVRLKDSQNDYGERSPVDEFQMTLTQNTVFELIVVGTGEAPERFTRRIQVNVLPIPPPPPPTNITGVAAALDAPIKLRWNYPGADQDRIVGFRVYRANTNDFDFRVVATEFELLNTVREWEDGTLPACNHAYYIVAVYEDITLTGANRFRETEASPNSWQTQACP